MSLVDGGKTAGQAEPNRPGSPETNPQGCACALVDTLGKLGNMAMHECAAVPDFPTAASVCKSSGWSGDLSRSYALS